MQDKKKKILIIIKGILLAVLFVCLNFLVLNIYYEITKENIDKYISSDFSGLVRADSLNSFYNSFNDLRASDIILSNIKIDSIYKTVNELRKKKYDGNNNLKSLLNNKVNIVFRKNNSVVLLFDLGFRSVFFNASKFLSKYFSKNDYFLIQVIKNREYTLYKIYFYESRQTLYFSLFENLLFAGFNKEDLDYIYDAKNKKKNIFTDDNFKTVKNKIKKNGIAEVYINTPQVLSPIINNNFELTKIFNKYNFEKKSVLSFDISNEKFYLSAFTKYSANDKRMNDFNWKESGGNDVVRFLPANTDYYSIFNLRSFEEFYKLFLYLETGIHENKIEELENKLKKDLNSNLNEQLYGWIGDELGIYSTEKSNEPVLFLRIKSKNKMETFIKNIIISKDLKNKNFKISEKIIQKIKMPDYLKIVKSTFKLNSNFQYFEFINDYLFFSSDASSLSDLNENIKNEKFLKDDKDYKSVSGRVKDRSSFFVYFNLHVNKIPGFLKSKSFISDIIKLYEKGLIALNLDNGNLDIDIACAGINMRKISLFADYPKKNKYQINSPVVCMNIDDSQGDELIYVANDNRLYVTDVTNESLPGFPVKLKGSSRYKPIIASINKNSGNEIFILTENGFLHCINANGKETAGYPIQLDFKSDFNPVIINNEFLFFSKKDKKLFLMKNGKLNELDFKFENNLLSSPSVTGGLFSVFLKNENGLVYLCDNQGKILKGWPNESGGFASGSPVLKKFGRDNNNSVIFLTQNGLLNIWSYEGVKKENFPMKLSGIFNNQPKIGIFEREGQEEIVTLGDDGTLSIISNRAVVILFKRMKEIASKDNKLHLFDVNNDGVDEIIVYGANNFIYAYNSKLNILPGFPVKGKTKPEFADLNFDGENEMITYGSDDLLYIYSIPKL